jgi:NADH-quinone oxidoreductase subunit L
MTKMGGIYRKIPITYAMMWIGSLALAGFPPFAGFFSKDVILEAAYMSDAKYGQLSYILGVMAAFLTTFYSWRLLFLVFHGKPRMDQKTYNHAHESPISMQIPLFILAIGAIISGYIGMNQLSFVSAEGNFFRDSIFVASVNSRLLEDIHNTPYLIKYAPLALGIIAIIMAYIIYLKKTNLANILAKKLSYLYKISFNKYYFDEIYQIIFINPVKKSGNFLWRVIDVKIIDGVPNLLAQIARYFSLRISKLETGLIYSYSGWMVFGLILILLFIISSIKDFPIF